MTIVRRTCMAALAGALVAVPAFPAAWTFAGNAHDGGRRLRQMLAVAGDTSGTAVEPIVAGILAACQRDGYWRASATVTRDSPGTSGTITIDQGPLFMVGRITFEGNRVLGEQYLLQRMETQRGSIADSGRIARDLSCISEAYADNGFPQAAIAVGDVALADSTLELAISVDEGPMVTITEVVFRGNAATRTHVARRLAGITPPIAFRRDAVIRARNNLLRSGLFASVGRPELLAGPEPAQQSLAFTVAEGRYNSVTGAAGYTQATAEEPGWWAGAADLSLRNIAGTARALQLQWERPRRDNSRLTAGYREPWMLGSPAALELSLRHRIEDSTYSQTAAEALATIPLGDHFAGGIGGRLERTVPGSLPLVRRSLTIGSQWQVSGDYRTGERMAGWMALLRMEYGRKRYYDPGSQLSVGRLWSDGLLLAATGAGQALSCAVHARAVISGERPVPRPDQFTMGGARSLRGFFEDQFTGDQVAWANVEYRFRPAREFVAFPFFDAGYAFDGYRTGRILEAGYGLGFRMETRLGWTSIVYGLGRHDGPFEGKVHIGLGNEF